MGDTVDQGAILSHLGEIHYVQGNYEQAIALQQHWLDISRANGFRPGEGIALGSLGNIYEAQGSYPQAVTYHRQHLVLARADGDLEMEGAALGNLGVATIPSVNMPRLKLVISNT